MKERKERIRMKERKENLTVTRGIVDINFKVATIDLDED
jgi:hypothetical protein